MGNHISEHGDHPPSDDNIQQDARKAKAEADEAIKKETNEILDNISGTIKKSHLGGANAVGKDDYSCHEGGEMSERGASDNLGKLAKAMASRSHKLKKSDGICQEVFRSVVSPKSDILGICLFNYFLRHAKRKKDGGLTLSKDSFVCEARKLLDLIRDDSQLEFYVKVFSVDEHMVSQESFRKFLRASLQYWLPESKSSIVLSQGTEKTIEAVTRAAYHGKVELSVKFIAHWIQENLPRVVLWMHKFVVHQLTVGHRLIKESPVSTPSEENKPVISENPAGELERTRSVEKIISPSKEFHTSVGLKLQRMMSDKSFFEKRPYLSVQELNKELEKTQPESPSPNAFVGALHLSQVWLLSSTLPDMYNRAPSGGTPVGFSILDPQTLIAKLLNPDIPSHWTTIYDSDRDGLSLNRFQHHIFGYRGPTVVMVRGDCDQSFVIAVDTEWRESTKFWGGTNCIALQLTPEFKVMDRGEKMMYYNVTSRGYPFGVQVGTDYKNPAVEIDKDFTRVYTRKIPYKLDSVHVWGCATQETREAQLVHKKWELGQVERAKKVNLNACDWDEHPDKYLMELNGRASYNQLGNI